LTLTNRTVLEFQSSKESVITFLQDLTVELLIFVERSFGITALSFLVTLFEQFSFRYISNRLDNLYLPIKEHHPPMTPFDDINLRIGHAKLPLQVP
jgi:hypothetical protein